MAELVENAGRDPQSLPVAHATAEAKFRLLFSSIGVDDPEYEKEYLNAMRDAGLFCVRMLLCRLQGAESVEAVRKTLNQSMRIRGPHAKNLSSLLYGDYGTVERRLLELGVLREPDFSGDWRELLFSLDLNPDLAPSLRFATGVSLPTLLGLSPDDPHAVEEACGDIRCRVPVFQQSADLLAVLEAALTRATAVVSTRDGMMTHQGAETAVEVRGPVDVEVESTATIGSEEDVQTKQSLSESVPVLGPSEFPPMEEEQHVVLGPAPTPPLTAFSGHREVLRGHTLAVNCLCLLPDNMMISGSYDNTLILWNLITKECIRVFRGHADSVLCVALLLDGRVISGSEDKTLRIWNPSTGKKEKVLTGHKYRVSCVSVLSGNRVISGDHGGTLIVWDVRTGSALSVLRRRVDSLLCLVDLPNGHIASNDFNRILILDLPTQKSVRTLSGHKWTVTCLSVLSSDRLASGSGDRTIRIWNYVSGVCISVLRGHKDAVCRLCVLSDGRLVSAGDDNDEDTKIRIWNTETGECTQTIQLQGHRYVISCLLSLSDGRLALGSNDNTILLWS